MSSTYKISAACLRYIIPFKYNDDFAELCRKIERHGEEIIKIDKKTGMKESTVIFQHDWVRRIATLGGAESDLYNYIRNEFKFKNAVDPLPEENIGCEWIFWRSNESKCKDGIPIKQFMYFCEGISKHDTKLPDGEPVSITNVGIYLFRNGIGFVWYEISIPLDTFDSEKLKMFQYQIRELNRGNKTFLWEETIEKPLKGIVLKETKKCRTYLKPFSIEHWIFNELLSDLNISYMAERKSSYASMIKKSMDAVKNLPYEIIDQEAPLTKIRLTAPDKAILFSYISFDRIEEEDHLYDRQVLSYHITNGYKNSYHFSEDTAKEMKRPFENVLWYATQEGASYLAWPYADNQETFNNLIPGKIRTDYFRLFIKTLYQSYSLLIYAERIQKEISAVNRKYLTEPLDQHITELFGEINLFLTKSMATSVSHIHHQSSFYIYLKEQLRIHEDVKSVTAGLNGLDVLLREQRQREDSRRTAEEWQGERERDRQAQELRERREEREKKRDREAQELREKREEREKKNDAKLQAIMGLFALLGISSALVDCFDFIAKASGAEKWADLSGNVLIAEIAAMILIGVISICAFCVSVKAIYDAFKKD